MAINKRLIATEVGGGGAACTTDTLQILGDSSCIAYYKMADATDESGSYNGTPTDVNFNVEGKFGNAGDFNGSSSIINLGDHNVFSPSVNPLSFSLWIKKSTSDFNSIFSKGASGSYEYALFISGSGVIELQASTLTYSSNINLTTSASYSDGNWHHVVAIYDPSGNFKIYVDGSQQATSSSSLSMGNSSNALIIGRKYENNVDIFNGSIDEVRIFNKALSSTEIITLYNEVQCIPTIVASQNFQTITYTGNGGTQSTNSLSNQSGALSFQPDFTWIKARSVGYSSAIYDAVRGATYRLVSNTTDASTSPTTNGLTAFNSNGFTLGGGNTSSNGSGTTYASWNWKAGGSAVSGTGAGAISSVSASANQDAGFSVVKYSNSGASGTYTHGLNSAPEVVIRKRTDSTSGWVFATTVIDGSYDYLLLNTTAGKTDYAIAAPTSTVVTEGDVGTYISYNFHSVESYSRIGSYKGNGSTNGTLIVTGFEPAFVIIKKTSGAGAWMITDNKRNTSNPRNSILQAQAAAQESTSTSNNIDFYTNGFQIKTTNGDYNSSGGTYIFMAFAQDPDTTPATLANSFEAKTYTGNGGNQSITLSNGMKPDFVWIKSRDTTGFEHCLFDTVRGAGASKVLFADTTQAQGGNLAAPMNSFDSNGFTVSTRADGNANILVNKSGDDLIAWNWKAADHDRDLATINQDGSITSLVSANPASGFSIVGFTGNGSVGSVGHGLDSTPELIIMKNRDGTNGWVVRSSALGNGYLLLNSSNAYSSTAFWVNPTDSVFSFTSSSSGTISNNKHIAYCFTSITSYQKIGSYNGSGVAGKRVYVTNDGLATGSGGFQPSYVLIKCSTASSTDWLIFTSNVVDGSGNPVMLRANTAESQFTGDRVQFTSDGFTIEDADGSRNGSGRTYIYLAIA